MVRTFEEKSEPREQEPVAVSASMKALFEAADDVAPTNTTVLLLGESGTGKEVMARYIHKHSTRASGPWVAVNCAALPADLLESELFGHERGAFTGANERRVGRIEQAHGGTLLLDEISEMPLHLQAKLLRVLQEREVDRVGGTKPIPVDVRVLATSNRDLLQMAKDGGFRLDLFYRLDVFPLHLPPLRERLEDLPELARTLLARLSRGLNRAVPMLDDSALQALSTAKLAGNVRELGNLLERALVRCKAPVMTALHLGPLEARAATGQAFARPQGQKTDDPKEPSPDSWCEAPGAFPQSMPLDLGSLERLAINEALRRTGGNRTKAATLLGIGLRTLRQRLNGTGGASECAKSSDTSEMAVARPVQEG
ncbi:MAG: sigma-54-dependent Fis family transcriptional regulator [Deltaproteobacteria bacterium]|nr:sigma-54-dependent Fis family transcriptional regulator [Deltaproteobacteria bacterium]